MSLFPKIPEVLDLPNAQLVYFPHFISKEKADSYYEILRDGIPWQQDDIKVFGKIYTQPRLTALFGDSDKSYSYSGITMQPNPFTSELLEIKKCVESKAGDNFTSVLLNLYRNGNDSNGWHADNEKELGKNPTIASVSFGAERWFHFKHRTLKEQKHKIILHHGSLLIMKGEMQHFWLHQIAKTKRQIEPRINLTFRKLIN